MLTWKHILAHSYCFLINARYLSTICKCLGTFIFTAKWLVFPHCTVTLLNPDIKTQMCRGAESTWNLHSLKAGSSRFLSPLSQWENSCLQFHCLFTIFLWFPDVTLEMTYSFACQEMCNFCIQVSSVNWQVIENGLSCLLDCQSVNMSQFSFNCCS